MTNSDSRMINGLIIGVGLGLVAGLLWAPRRGEEIREELSRGADDGLAYLRDEANKIRHNADPWLTRLQAFFCRRDQAG